MKNNIKYSKKLKVNKSSGANFKHGELRQYVLSALGLGILLGGTFLVTPNFPIVFATVVGLIKELTEKKLPQNKVKRVLKNLEKRDLITLSEKNGEVHIRLRSGFTPILLKYSLKPLLELKKKKKKWDGKWFLVFFDVPIKQNNKRTHLRNFLKYIGFYPYQQSVYIFPYECEKEVGLIKKIVEGAKYMSYVIAEKIEMERQVKTYFGLT